VVVFITGGSNACDGGRSSIESVKWGFQSSALIYHGGVHEISPGEFDFGEVNPDYDLNAFLTLCEDKDLRVLLRPGPHINSEITYFGFPKRVIEDPMVPSFTLD